MTEQTIDWVEKEKCGIDKDGSNVCRPHRLGIHWCPYGNTGSRPVLQSNGPFRTLHCISAKEASGDALWRVQCYFHRRRQHKILLGVWR